MTARISKIHKILIANRGEIACRLIKAAKELGIITVAVYTASDCSSLHVKLADDAVLLPNQDAVAYIDGAGIIEIALANGVNAIIPGYGFLSENAEFAEDVIKAGMAWVGPKPSTITSFGLKHKARELAVAAGVPVVPGTGLLESAEEAVRAATSIGLPVMLKASAGGGGMGLVVCHNMEEVRTGFETVAARAGTLYKDSTLFMEKYVEKGRHIEVQVFGNGQGFAAHFGERECSIQRRHQKVIEECPSPFVTKMPGLRKTLTDCAVRLAASVHYESAGTVEFLVDDDTAACYFLEMNTRLQVEHGITELCYKVDLVHLMLLQADLSMDDSKGGLEPDYFNQWQTDDGPCSAAIEARINAETPSKDFSPSPGTIHRLSWPDEVRVDTWVQTGSVISPFYDSLIAKLIVHEPNRRQATASMVEKLSQTVIQGCSTNKDFLLAIVSSSRFAEGDTLTSFLTNFDGYHPTVVEVIKAGPYDTIQDVDGRPGHGNGVPSSGAMDGVSLSIANMLVGNDRNEAGIEMTLAGPTLKFSCPATVALGGATMEADLNGKRVDMFSRIDVPAGGILRIGQLTGAGCRAYLVFAGGLPNVPSYLGSKATFTIAEVGGVQGRKLRNGDLIDIVAARHVPSPGPISIPEYARPSILFSSSIALHALPGPHNSPEFITPNDIESIFTAEWKVGHQATRSGYRLQGPILDWGRKDGGDGGGHPSNVVGTYYQIGACNCNGDEPVVFAADSPTNGALAVTHSTCPGDMWRLGQSRPGDTITFRPVSHENAVLLSRRLADYITRMENSIRAVIAGQTIDNFPFPPDALVEVISFAQAAMNLAEDETPEGLARYRQVGGALRDWTDHFQAGQEAIEIAWQDRILTVKDNIGLFAKANRIQAEAGTGVASVMATGSALSVIYDPEKTSQESLLARLRSMFKSSKEESLGKFKSRLFHLPVTFDSPEVLDCIQKYIETQRSIAAYLPDNAQFIAECNGLKDRRAVFDSLLTSEQLVIQVSWYCGLPSYMPLDPRKKLVAAKYNPTRTSTPRGTVGLGGSTYATYPIDATGGVPIFGTTLPTWDSLQRLPGFEETPWLFEQYDRLQFYETTGEEFNRIRRLHEAGLWRPEVVEGVFDAQAHVDWMESVAEEVVLAERRRAQAMQVMQVRIAECDANWQEVLATSTGASTEMKMGDKQIECPMVAAVWQSLVKKGDIVHAGQVVVILEAMKLEIPCRVEDDMDGATVVSVIQPGSLVQPGDILVSLQSPRK
ncbi:allophanate hydrolase subunit 2-domain-containing protein [Naematelia encephala]|uniref:Allophanate hydrolase subunit 2-domain-containing protein n=1 Tax=Naematelia encephala TaxID=71784 RepID=A0A1Y2APP7_9TREE|nr:allophanate hydrolase subunit 2-domain-containing protein [Naematelia encephala]